jgi:hypothetical protein
LCPCRIRPPIERWFLCRTIAVVLGNRFRSAPGGRSPRRPHAPSRPRCRRPRRPPR